MTLKPPDMALLLFALAAALGISLFTAYSCGYINGANEVFFVLLGRRR